MDDGYEFFADRRLVTIFSAPNYCNEFDNDGAMLSVDEDLNCSFVKLTPKEKMLMYNKNSFKNGKGKFKGGIFPKYWMKSYRIYGW